MVAVVGFSEIFCFISGVILTLVFMVIKDIDKEEAEEKAASKPQRRVNGLIRK